MARDLCVGARSLVRLPEAVAPWVRSLHLIRFCGISLVRALLLDIIMQTRLCKMALACGLLVAHLWLQLIDHCVQPVDHTLWLVVYRLHTCGFSFACTTSRPQAAIVQPIHEKYIYSILATENRKKTRSHPPPPSSTHTCISNQNITA